MNTPAKPILKKTLSELALSKDLVELFRFHGYDTLDKVLEKNISFHRSNNGLTIHDELELFRFVKENGLQKLWKNE